MLIEWRERAAPLSPVEACVFARIALSGSATFHDIDNLLVELGGSPGTRSLVLLHLKQKFRRLGAADPLERAGKNVIRLIVEADEEDSTVTLIGLTA